MTHHAVRFVALAAIAGLMAACGGSAVSAEDIEEEAQTQFEGQFPIDSVECDEDLPAELGATITCVLVSDGQPFEMTVTTSEVEDGTVSFNLEVNEEP